MPEDYKQQLIEAKNAYKAKDYEKSFEIYTSLYGNVPFDNSAKYSYAWAVYQVKIRDYESEEELLEYADLVTSLTKQNNLNLTRLCVYTMSVMKVLKLLYHDKDFESLPFWLDKINPDLLDQNRPLKDGRRFPSNMEHYYIYASVTYFKLRDYEKCIITSRHALSKLNKFTDNSAEFFQWRIAKSYRQLGNYEAALKFLMVLQLDEWYVLHEIAENYYFLDDHQKSLEYAVRAALKDGPMDMKYNLYMLLYELLRRDYPEMADKHEKLCELIRYKDDVDKQGLEEELLRFWKTIDI